MNSKVNSLEEKVKLPPTETISRCYQPQQSNRKVIRILTVAVYVLCVSLAAIMLSLYYIFIWDPTIRPFVTKATHCGKPGAHQDRGPLQSYSSPIPLSGGSLPGPTI